MANVSSKIGSFILRRLYSAVAQRVSPPTIATVSKNAARATVAGEKEAVRATESVKDVAWMRDPKTGIWMPENHFNQVDPVDLRIKFLASHATKTN